MTLKYRIRIVMRDEYKYTHKFNTHIHTNTLHAISTLRAERHTEITFLHDVLIRPHLVYDFLEKCECNVPLFNLKKTDQ